MDVIAGELQDRDFGIVILTKDNMSSPWINFEAGALGKSLGTGKVAPLLLDVTRADVEGPISQFQNTLLTDATDMRQFVRDLCAFTPGVPEESVDALFSVKWPELQAVVERAVGMDNLKTSRSTESMLEEVLEHVRSLRRSKRPAVLGEQDEQKRQARLQLLERRSGIVVNIENYNGDALDYDPFTDEVLIPSTTTGPPFWLPAADAQLTPF